MKAILNIHFEILGVTSISSKEDIKKAYRLQMKLWHPDKFQNAPEKIVEALERSKMINEAFHFLRDYLPKEDVFKSSANSTKTKPNSTRGIKIDIQRIRVKSSNIHSIGYDSPTSTLQIQFLSGGLYQYYNVPKSIFNELMKSESKGKYLNRNIYFRYNYESV